MTRAHQPGEWLLEYSSNEDSRTLQLKVFPMGAGCDAAFGAYDVAWVAGGAIERSCDVTDSSHLRRRVTGEQQDEVPTQRGGVIQRRCIVIDSSNVCRHVKGKGGPQ